LVDQVLDTLDDPDDIETFLGEGKLRCIGSDNRDRCGEIGLGVVTLCPPGLLPTDRDSRDRAVQLPGEPAARGAIAAPNIEYALTSADLCTAREM
jgi:hypothetical protein